MNDDNFDKLKSADSMDESFTDTTSSCSEVNSNPDNDYCCPEPLKLLLTLVLGEDLKHGADLIHEYKLEEEEVEKREHKPLELYIICLQTNYLFLQYLIIKLIHQRIQVQTLKFMSLLLVSTISDNKINSSKDPSSDSEVYEPLSDTWKDDPPTIKDFPFNEEIELKLDVPENASPILFFKLIAFDQKVSG